MSDLMDEAVIMMPFDLAMLTELSRIQFYNRAQAILVERNKLKRQRLPTKRDIKLSPTSIDTDAISQAAISLNNAAAGLPDSAEQFLSLAERLNHLVELLSVCEEITDYCKTRVPVESIEFTITIKENSVIQG